MNVRDHGVSLRSEAIGMIKCGVSQKEVAQRLNVGERSVRRWWWWTYNVGNSLDTQLRSGRPKCLNRVAKTIINKSMGKRWQSVRKLSRKLTCEGYKTSKSTVHRHLSNSLGATPYKRPKIPRITDRIKENRLLFAQARVEWTVDDWKRVLWSDESPFEIFSTTEYGLEIQIQFNPLLR